MVGWAQARGSSRPDFGSGLGCFHIRPFRSPLALRPRGPEPSEVVSLLGGPDVSECCGTCLSLAPTSASRWRSQQNLHTQWRAWRSVTLRAAESSLQAALPQETGDKGRGLSCCPAQAWSALTWRACVGLRVQGLCKEPRTRAEVVWSSSLFRLGQRGAAGLGSAWPSTEWPPMPPRGALELEGRPRDGACT